MACKDRCQCELEEGLWEPSIVVMSPVEAQSFEPRIVVLKDSMKRVFPQFPSHVEDFERCQAGQELTSCFD